MERKDFWTEVFMLRGSVTPIVISRVAAFSFVALLVALGNNYFAHEVSLGVGHYEVVGVVLALLLVLRTNSGYDRWYEARKLWGGIVNQSRNLAVIGTTYGPDDSRWRHAFLNWTAAFPHVARHNLRGERNLEDVRHILRDQTAVVAASQHMPTAVAQQQALLLREAVERGGMDRFAFIQAESERAQLIDHIGACERILKTPLARVFSIKIRRFLFIYLFVLPFALVDKSGLFTPLITALVAYPLLALDQIGIELQNPFSENQLSHLPLGDICQTIEDNVLALDIGDPYEAHDHRILPLSLAEHDDVVMSASYDSPAPAE